MDAGQHIGRLQRGAAWGRYVILDYLGGGAMGVVYAAYDARLERRVALKLLRPDSSHATSPSEGRARLLREAQAMARLSHPNVVAAYDADEIEGEVCLAMELVEGKTLRDWVAERPRHWREIVAAFVEAGRGLAAAHAVGVVHRDFKPDNVLVDRDGRVRVTDFSVARPSTESPPPAPRVPSEGQAPEVTLTRTGMLLGTPAYMAPEQLDGRTIDQRTDQFSFCVALYEALYGERPFAGSTIEALAFATAMGNMRPPRRDARVPSWLRRSLMRGLTADPEHRYPSMDSLLKALGRDPARSWRRWASVAAIALLALAGGGAVTAIRERSRQLCRAGDQKIAGLWDDARRGELQRAFLATGLPYAGDVWEGSRRILDPYVAGWLDMYRDTCEATHLRGEQSPELLDLRMRCLEHRRQELRALVDVFSAADGKVVENAVQAAQARTPLSSCVDAPTLATRVRLPEDPGMRKRVEELHTDLARVKALTDAGKFAEALPLAEAAVKAGREIGDSPLLAEALLHLEPAVSGASSQYKRSEAVLEEAVETAIAGRDGQTLATALVTLIPIAGEHQQHFEEGHRWSRQAKAAIIALGGGQEALEATRLCNTSRVFRMQGKHSEAVQQAHQCIALKERSSGRDSLAVAAALKTLTQAQIHLGDFAQAAEQAHRATAALENLVGPRHLLVASALEQEGAARAEMKDPEGLPILLRARAVRQAVLGPDHQGVAQTESNLAMGLIQLGRLDEGLQLYDRVLTIYERTYGSTSWKIFFALYWIGEAHLRKGDVQDALKYARRGWAVGVKVLGPDHPGLAGPLLTEGKALLAAGDASRAVPKLEQSLALREAADVAPYRHAESAFALARALVATRGDQKRAGELAQRAQDLFRRQGKGFEDDLREVEQWQARRLASVKTR